MIYGLDWITVTDCISDGGMQYLGDRAADRIADGRDRRFDAVESQQRLPLGLVLGQLESVQGTLLGGQERGEGSERKRERREREQGDSVR